MRVFTVFKTEMLTCQSMAELDMKTLFVKLSYHLDQDIRKILLNKFSTIARITRYASSALTVNYYFTTRQNG